MKKFVKAFTAGVLALCLSACSLQDKVDQEIQIPIYETNTTVKTVKASLMDLEESTKTAASIGYATADALRTSVKGNLVTYKASSYKTYKEGDVLAAFDSSDLDYDHKKQSIYTQAALEAYQQSGTEAARLEYEYQNALLQEIEYQMDQYVIYAPYDCIVTDAVSFTTGAEVEAGTYVCSVAPVNDIFVYIGYDSSKDKNTPFKLGTKVTVTLAGEPHEGRVVSTPDSKTYNHPLKYMSDFSLSSSDYSVENLGLAGGDYKLVNTGFGGSNGSSVAADSNTNIFIGFEPEVLAALLEETPNAVKAGWATVHIVTKRYSNVLVLPKNAVTVKDSSYVYLYENGQRIQTPVTVGDTINGYTIILQGLREGDEVAY